MAASFMKIHFLGTGTSQGIPVIGSQHPVCLSNDPKDHRLRVSVWIELPHANIIIDCGPDFRYQMLRSKCPKVDAIIFTHEHADHTAGLDDIRPFYFAQGAIPIYAHQRVIDNLQRRFDYILNILELLTQKLKRNTTTPSFHPLFAFELRR
jgi:phosphoribosyl 1,2-cyclic phosphate phosphodiesterase